MQRKYYYFFYLKKLFFLFFLIITISCSESIKKEAILSSDSFYVDFGLIDYTDTQEYTFQLKNLGSDTLHFISMVHSCNLVQVSSQKEYLLPGDSLNMVYIFIPKDAGIYNENIVLRTSAKPEFYFFSINAEVK